MAAAPTTKPEFKPPRLTPRLAVLSQDLEARIKARCAQLPPIGTTRDGGDVKLWGQRMEAVNAAFLAKMAFVQHINGKGFRSQL